MSRPQRIGILGAGALGSLFAYALTSHTSLEVWLLARSSSLQSVTVAGEGSRPVRVSSQPSLVVDLLLVLVKAFATADALRWAKGAVGAETILLTLQNGLGNAEQLAQLAGPDRVLVGTTAQGATLIGPGHVLRGGSGPTLVAPWTPGGRAAAAAPHVAALLERAGMAAAVVADPQPLLWSKLAVNCGINALTAILRVPNGDLLRQPEARRIMTLAAAEAGAVAGAAGVMLPDEPVARTLAVAAATAANRSSMLQDILRGRRTEIDAINGAVAAHGESLGVPVATNRMLADLVRAMEGAKVMD